MQEPLVLRLEPRPHVKWEQDVVDNEHMNKRSSKREFSRSFRRARCTAAGAVCCDGFRTLHVCFGYFHRVLHLPQAARVRRELKRERQ